MGLGVYHTLCPLTKEIRKTEMFIKLNLPSTVVGSPLYKEMMMSRGAYVRIISIRIWLTRDLEVREVGTSYKMSKK